MNDIIIYSLVMLFGVFISSISQVMLKKSALKKYESVIKEYLNIRVMAAYSLFIIATFLSIYAYKVIPLSMGSLLEATGYIYVTIFGVLIFKERMSKTKAIGLLCIMFGILIYAS